ncbi:unnamed protein product [Pleuronectes platessa]|uniref:Uncharacterized protein n=1 Tax=Pleuronectes platessa TaxID=8262 RepID=A0A9N7TNZ6_PLEPL|nr:unnamed protein product [Pleuronectes platessa]
MDVDGFFARSQALFRSGERELGDHVHLTVFVEPCTPQRAGVVRAPAQCGHELSPAGGLLRKTLASSLKGVFSAPGAADGSSYSPPANWPLTRSKMPDRSTHNA